MSIPKSGKHGLVFQYNAVYREEDILPYGESYPIFNIIGGRVAITQIIGEVTTVIQTKANNTKLTVTPTGGSAVDLCSENNISADAVGTMYGITGTTANAMVSSLGSLVPQAQQLILDPGTINLDCVEESTGGIKWAIYYSALDEGAYIEAADPYSVTTTTPEP